MSENRIKIGLSTHRSFTPFPLSKCKSVLSSSLFSVKQLFEQGGPQGGGEEGKGVSLNYWIDENLRVFNTHKIEVCVSPVTELF